MILLFYVNLQQHSAKTRMHTSIRALFIHEQFPFIERSFPLCEQMRSSVFELLTI